VRIEGFSALYQPPARGENRRRSGQSNVCRLTACKFSDAFKIYPPGSKSRKISFET
jgi:hypothetical protein